MLRDIRLGPIIALVLVTGLGPVAAAIEQFRVEKVEEPATLPYRFHQFWKSSRRDAPEIFLPLNAGPDKVSYLCRITSDWVGEGTVSSLVFFHDFSTADIVSQQNFSEVNWIIHHYACDFDGDAIDEVAVTFRTGDSLWLALVDRSDGVIYRRCLYVGNDINNDGIWDGDGPLHHCGDLTGDGRPEVLVEVRSGFDLYPRMLQCIDYSRDTLLWQYELAGSVAHVLATPLQPRGRPVILVGTRGPGNGATVDAMNDWHSYLIALNAAGEELWWVEMSTEYTSVLPVVTDINADDDLEVIGAYRYCRERDSSGSCLSWGGAYKIFDYSGALMDSVDLGPGRGVFEAIAVDLEMDDEQEVLMALADSTIVVFNSQMIPEEVCRFYSAAHLWGALDFLATGTKQLLVFTGDDRAWLLDRDFKPLAQYPEARLNETVKPYRCSEEGVNYGLVLSLDFRAPSVLLSLEKTSWFFIFYRQPELAFLAAFLPMAIIVGGIGVYSHTVRKKNKIISKTRDQLQDALDELKLAQRKLVAAEKQKQMKVIAGGVAHEVHNALCPAANALDVLRGKLDLSQTAPAKLVDLIDAAITRAMRMTELVKDFAKLDTLQQDESVQVRPMVEETVSSYQARLEHEDITITTDIPESLVFSGVPTHLQSLLTNLIGNAIDAVSGADRRAIRIAAEPADGRVPITVADSGVGIAEESLPKIFEAFYTTKPGKGTGLGLTIVKRVVDIYDGEIEVQSEPSRGTRFTIWLPAVISMGDG